MKERKRAFRESLRILARAGREPLSRREVLFGLAGLGIGGAAFAAVGCGKDKEPELTLTPLGEPQTQPEASQAVVGEVAPQATQEPMAQAQPIEEQPKVEPPTVEPEPAPEPEPQLTPLEKAIQAGRLELNPNVENDWENYFTRVTVEEAEKLLEEANRDVAEAEDLKILFPFDPEGSRNLIIEIFKNHSEAFPGWIMVGFNGLEPGTVFYAPYGGDVKLFIGGTLSSNSPTYVDVILRIAKDIEHDAGDYGSGHIAYGFEFRKEGVEPQIPLWQGTDLDEFPQQVRVGDSLVKFVEDVGPISRALVPYQSEGVLFFFPSWRTLPLVINSLTQFLTKDGKIAFIAQE